MRTLVVGLAVVLAAAGSAFADGKSGNSGDSSSTTTTTGSTSSSSASSGNHQSTASRSSGSGGAPVARHNPANVPSGVQVNANGRILPSVDRAELLARQAALARQAIYYNRTRMNSAPVQGNGAAKAGDLEVAA